MDEHARSTENCASNGNFLSRQYGYEEVQTIANFIQQRIKCRPTIAVVCGTGLGNLVDCVDEKEILNYTDIPGFPVCTAQGHVGRLIFGKIANKTVAVMQGRVHMYEGYSTHQMALPIRVMRLLGIQTLILTNAAGGINREYKVGDVMIIKDHINIPGFSGFNPLVGPNDQRFGPRWLPIVYDTSLRKVAKQVSKELDMEDFVREGVYNFQSGPMFESVAECKFLKTLGADAAGMSTVPEAIAANHCGMNVLAFSLITNICVMDYDTDDAPNAEEVIETGKSRNNDLIKFVSRIIEKIQ